jgi:hypothetical protein
MRTAEMLAWVLSVAAIGSAGAQPLPPSPYDTNPKCTQRTTAPDDPECVLPQEGEPRHTYPPRRGGTKPPPPPPPQPPQNPPAMQKGIDASGNGSKLR